MSFALPFLLHPVIQTCLSDHIKGLQNVPENSHYLLIFYESICFIYYLSERKSLSAASFPQCMQQWRIEDGPETKVRSSVQVSQVDGREPITRVITGASQGLLAGSLRPEPEQGTNPGALRCEVGALTTQLTVYSHVSLIPLPMTSDVILHNDWVFSPFTLCKTLMCSLLSDFYCPIFKFASIYPFGSSLLISPIWNSPLLSSSPSISFALFVSFYVSIPQTKE